MAARPLNDRADREQVYRQVQREQTRAEEPGDSASPIAEVVQATIKQDLQPRLMAMMKRVQRLAADLPEDRRDQVVEIEQTGARLLRSLSTLLDRVALPPERVPAQPEATATAEAAPMPSRPSTAKPRLLVVEDDKSTQWVLERMLQDTYQVELAASVAEALRKADAAQAANAPYDGFLLDINLGTPRSEVDLLRELRVRKAYRSVPAVACTAATHAMHREQMLAEGFDEYVSKPFTKKMLLQTVTAVIVVPETREGVCSGSVTTDAPPPPSAAAEAKPVRAKPDATDAPSGNQSPGEQAPGEQAPGEQKAASKASAVGLRIPPLPDCVTDIIEVLSGAHTAPDVERLQNVLHKDPVLASWVLAHVNSAYFGLSSKVSDLNRAVMLLGVKPVCNLLLMKMLAQVFADLATPAARQVYKHLLATSVATGAVAKDLASFLKAADPELAFTTGLLHQVGRLVLLSQDPHHYPTLWEEAGGAPHHRGVPTLRQEREQYDTDSVELGLALVKQWALPSELSTVMRHYDRPERITNRPLQRLALVTAAGLAVAEDLLGPAAQDGDELGATALEGLGRLASVQDVPLTSLSDFVRSRLDPVRELLARSV